MRLMIVESPTKARKISSILGDGWIVKASLGHIVDLPAKELGIDPETYTLSYVPSQRGKEIISALQPLVAEANEIYLATDPDREGEAISQHLRTNLRINRYKRITFNEITEAGIKKALKTARQIDGNLVHAQEARRALDRLIGFGVSFPLSSSAGMNLSAGRCQSPAVRLVVERQVAIDSFKVTDHFSALVEFDEGAWSAEWVTKYHLQPDEEYIVDQVLAELAASCRNFTVLQSTEKPQTKSPPAPFTTSTLLQVAGATLGFSPALTQTLAQRLFEDGHITYHRTDNPNISDDGVTAICALAAQENWPVSEKHRKWPSPQGAQEAHEAIRPTHVEERDSGEGEQQRALYKLIWRRAVGSQLADAQYRIVTLDLASDDAGERMHFAARSALLTDNGWKTLASANDKADVEDDEEVSNGQVPLLQSGVQLQGGIGKLLRRSTKPPRQYSETSLIRKLEKMGIGRPSTFAAIVKHICDKHYVQVEKRNLFPTAAGYAIVKNLVGHFSFIDYSYTKELETSLDLIADGKQDYLSVVSAFNGKIKGEVGKISSQTAQFPCPACGNALRQITGKEHIFWGCAGYQDGCPIICEDDKGRPGAVIGHTDIPSEKAVSFAQKLAVENRLTVPGEVLESARLLREWTDVTFKASQPRLASASQRALIAKLVEQKQLDPPEGWPVSVTLGNACDFISSNIGRKRNVRTWRGRPRRRA